MSEGAGVPRRYLAYLLRLWTVGGASEARVWQASLEVPRTHEQRHFADLASLIAFLQAEMAHAPAAPGAPQPAGSGTQGEPPRLPPVQKKQPTPESC